MRCRPRELCWTERGSPPPNTLLSLCALILPLALTLCLIACGDGGDDGGDDGGASSTCGADITGSVFGLNEGTATLKGTVTLPPDTSAGLTINLMVIEGNSAARRGVVPDFNFTPGTSNTCLANLKTSGEQFTYEIRDLEAGDYRLHLKLLEGEGGMSQEVYDQSSETSVTVVEDEVITHDEAFVTVD